MSRPPSSMARLTEILDSELEQLEVLRDLGEQEREAVKTLDTDALLAIGRSRLQRLEVLRTLEQERAAVVNQLATEWGLPPETLTLDVLLDHVEAAYATPLRARQRRLTEAVGAVRAAMAMNRLLVSRFLTFVRDALAACSDTSVPVTIYAPSGQLRTAAGGAALLERRG